MAVQLSLRRGDILAVCKNWVWPWLRKYLWVMIVEIVDRNEALTLFAGFSSQVCSYWTAAYLSR